MSKFWNAAISILCVGIASAAIYWQIHKAKVAEYNLAEKERLCRISADRGDAQGQYCLGSLYYYGHSLPQDYTQAMNWYRKAADQGNAQAQSGIGSIYYYGNGVQQDYVEALRWYHKAADQGDVGAENAIGSMYYYGRGVTQDRSEAARWYRKAADGGFAKAQYDLGLLYYYGQGVTQDRAEAYRWFHKAANQGNDHAQRMVGQWPAGWMNLRFALLFAEFLIGILLLISCLRSRESLNSLRQRIVISASGFCFLSSALNFFSATYPEIRDIRLAFVTLAAAKLLSQGTVLVLLFINYRLAKGRQMMVHE